MFQIERRQNFIDRRARGRPRGINPSTRRPYPPWMRAGWCCGPHGGPRELQSWRAWAPGLGPEIHPPRQARTVRPPLPPYQPRSASHLSIMRLIVLFIAVARESPALSIRWSVLTILPRLNLVLLHAVAVLLCSVSLSTCQPKPPTLLVVRFMLTIAVLVCRFQGLVDCCIGALLASWSTLPRLCTLVLRQGLVFRSNIMTSPVPD